MEFSSGGYKRISYVGGRTKFCYLDRDLPLFGIVTSFTKVAATEPGFPIKMPVRDLELHSEL